MALTLEQLQSAFKREESSSSDSSNNNYYPFWDMEIGQKCVIRFLPDKDVTNPKGFLIEKFTHRLDVAGKQQSIPCLKNYDEDCPICKVSQAYYKDGDEENGKTFWRKKNHLAQVIIVEDPLPPNPETGENHEGKLRYISLGYQLFNIIKAEIESGDSLDYIPFDFERGTDFIITKSQQGKYATYSIGSKFARKPRPLTPEEIAEAEENMIELKTLLPPHPGIDRVEQLLNSALTGTPPEFTPNNETAVETSTVQSTNPVETTPTSEPSATVDSSDDDIEDEADAILARIRQRNAS